MTEPIVATWTDKDGVQHWGSVDVAPAEPEKPATPKPSPRPAEEVRADAPEIPANGDGADPKLAKR